MEVSWSVATTKTIHEKSWLFHEIRHRGYWGTHFWKPIKMLIQLSTDCSHRFSTDGLDRHTWESDHQAVASNETWLSYKKTYTDYIYIQTHYMYAYTLYNTFCIYIYIYRHAYKCMYLDVNICIYICMYILYNNI